MFALNASRYARPPSMARLRLLPVAAACLAVLAVLGMQLGGHYPEISRSDGTIGPTPAPEAAEGRQRRPRSASLRVPPIEKRPAPGGPALRAATPVRRFMRAGEDWQRPAPLAVPPADAAPPLTPAAAGQASAAPSGLTTRPAVPVARPPAEPSGDAGARYGVGRRLAAGGCIHAPAFARANDTVVVLHRGPRTGVGAAAWAGLDEAGPHFLPWAGFTVAPAPCPVGCTVTADQGEIPTADAVVFEPPGYAMALGHRWRAETGLAGMETPGHKPRGQLWGAVHYETSEEFPDLADRAVVSQVDFWATYREDAEVPVALTCPWGDGADERAFLQPPPPKSPDHVVVYVASRCDGHASARDMYVEDLMRHIAVHSYGACLHNRDLPPEMAEAFHQWPRRYDLKMALFRRYMFVLAFENANVTDYVTEKLPHAVQGLAVPVYMGTRAVERWAPGSHSFIHVSDFASPRHLANYLLWLRDHPRAYRRYFAWKFRPLRPQFRDRLRRCVLTHGACRICQFVHRARCGAGANETRRALPDM